MRIAIGSDHAGFALKEAVKVFLTAEHRDIRRCGSRRDKRAERGILLCGSGAGTSMAVQLAWTRPEHDVQMPVRLSEIYI
jgi:ribose 5-phosphate isomerase RpiB